MSTAILAIGCRSHPSGTANAENHSKLMPKHSPPLLLSANHGAHRWVNLNVAEWGHTLKRERAVRCMQVDRPRGIMPHSGSAYPRARSALDKG